MCGSIGDKYSFLTLKIRPMDKYRSKSYQNVCMVTYAGGMVEIDTVLGLPRLVVAWPLIGSICDRGFDNRDAAVVCRTMGQS